LERWRQYGEKPDYAGLLTYGGAPYTQDPAELAGFDVAIVGAPTDDLVSDRPAPRVEGRRLRGAEDRRLRRRCRAARRRGAEPRGDRAARRPGLRRRPAADRARRRPFD